MKNLRITCFLLCLLGSLATQAQNPYWTLCSSKKLTLANNTITNLLAPPAPWCTPGSANTAHTGGLFDVNGNIIFSIATGKVYNKTGTLIHTINSPIPNASGTTVKRVTVVPVPNGDCGEYYILYAAAVTIQNGLNDYYEVGAIKVTVDNFLNVIVSSNSISTVKYPIHSSSIDNLIETAVSKEMNGQRTMYISLQQGQISTNQIEKVIVTQNGVAAGGFLPITDYIIDPQTLELSPDQQHLAWIQSLGAIGKIIRVKNLTTGTITDITSVNTVLWYDSDLEFGPNSDDIYVTTGSKKLAVTSLSNPQSYSIIPNTQNLRGEIEWGSNNKLYATSQDGNLYTIAGQTVTAVATYNGTILPEQVDGETIQYAPHSPLNIYLTITINGYTQAHVSGGSGNYIYTWYGPSGTVVATGVQAQLCRVGSHDLVIRDNSSGCKTTHTFQNFPTRRCRSTSSEIKIGSPQVKAYPNPAADYLNVLANSEESIVQLQVVNFQGQVLMQINGNQRSQQRITTNGLKPGMYILNIVTDQSNSQVTFTVK
ncbi:hypothetical protein BKI52_08505 [marine bacterium AO1-C]|nr:hypothetical protein BKI52_08505 [marine bacterium AO1-C]